MPAAAILNNKTVGELADSVRRMIRDTDLRQPAVPDSFLREHLIGSYLEIHHQAGWDPTIPIRSGDTAAYSYTLTAGDHEMTAEDDNDLIALGSLYSDRRRHPLQFIDRGQLEAWVNEDLKRNGAIQRGNPRYWTVKVDQATATKMQNRFLVYPAPDVSTVFYWPRTFVQTASIGPSPVTTAKTQGLSFNLTWALQYKVAALALRSMSDADFERLHLSSTFADACEARYLSMLELEKQARAQHVLVGEVQQWTA